MKKILLTGSNGFVASRFYEYYKEQFNFILLNKNNFDMTDESKVYRLFKDEDIDIVFHTAAIADIGVCQNNPELAYKTNLQATINIAKGCSIKNSILAFASSDQIYSANTKDAPFTEYAAPMPGNIYAETKLEAEKEIATLTEKYYNLRLTWMFSMPERGKKSPGGIVLNIIKALMSDTPIYLSENDFRGLTYVYEVIENFVKIIELPYGNYNTGSENNLSVYDIGRIIVNALDMSHRADKILCKASDSRKDLRLSNEKLRTNGVIFSTSEQACKRCISEFL